VIAAGVDVMAHTVGRQPGYSVEQLARFKQQGTALTPTLSLFAKLPLPPEIVGRLVDNIVGQLKSFSENGNTVLFGTDVGYIPLYDTTLEYQLMHRALGERQVLASLTTNPASYFKAANKGKLEKGFDADIAILEGDPLADVTNLAKVLTPSVREGDLSKALSSVGWVERSETHHASRVMIDGFRFALPILHARRLATSSSALFAYRDIVLLGLNLSPPVGNPDTRCVNYSMKSPGILRSIRRRRCDAPRARPGASASTRRPVLPADGGFSVTLDGKPIRTPSGRHVVAPTRGIAEAIAVEWNAQGETIDPLTMPLTRFANSVAEVTDRVDAVADGCRKIPRLGSAVLSRRPSRGAGRARSRALGPGAVLGRERTRGPFHPVRGDRACRPSRRRRSARPVACFRADPWSVAGACMW
jgi:hypothetical protein